MTIGVQESGALEILQLLLPAGEDVYFALYEDEEATVECTDPDYVRVGYTGWVQSLDNRVRSNTAPITFAEFAESTHIGSIGLFRTDVGGTPFMTATLTFYGAGIDIDAGDYIEFPVGKLTAEVP